MELSDAGRRARIFDRPQGEGNGLIGVILKVYGEASFKFMSDSGKESEYIGVKLIIQYLDEEVKR